MADHDKPTSTDDLEKPEPVTRLIGPWIGDQGASRVERVIAVVAGLLSAVSLAALVLSGSDSVSSGGETAPRPSLTTPVPERGDPPLAEELARQAEQIRDSDPQGALRRLLAAHVVAPDRATYRIKVAEALLGRNAPTNLLRTRLDAGGPVRYAALSADASYLVTGTDRDGQMWQAGKIVGPARLTLMASVGSRVTAAAGAGDLSRTNMIIASGDGVSEWRPVTSKRATRIGQLSDHMTMIAVTADGVNAVTAEATTATLWDVSLPRPAPLATLPYDKPVTALAFAPGSRMVLAAGHADGSVTVHAIDLQQERTTARTLTSGGGPVEAVAVSADTLTVLALHRGGAISVWDLRSTSTEPTGTVSAAGKGPYRAWLGPSGDYAVIADAAGPPVMWSLAERQNPVRLLALAVDGNPAVPAMVTADGRALATIDRANTLALWDLTAMGKVLADPIPQACEHADLDDATWRQLVRGGAFANPCAAPALPTLSTT